MKTNVGQTDRIARIGIGAVFGTISLVLIAGYGGPQVLSPLLGVLSLPLLATGLSGNCGVYSLIGVDTCSVEAQQ